MRLFRFALLLSLTVSSTLFCIHPVQCDHGEEDELFLEINKYRASLNLTTLTKNENANCLANEMADQFKDQPCTNSTGANTVPGTEPQFPNYPQHLRKCHLNVSNTRDGSVMPACVPGLVPSLVLDNFTRSLYSGNLNDSKYTGIGIGSEDDWIVVVLTTNTSEGSFVPGTDDNSSANIISKFQFIYFIVLFLAASFFL
ncbi:uncharacterized GPI-anchored protein At3g06035-like [Arachis stenosperma]|uniref:uncharacterized GPI-anchored protein At3g06035-like n=1 Tax=Arachis stenosperma TaxID=217475 RepID=UPI0025AC07FE|nr:uncharacterized GPI-anchored protein At3g06035-like [Arachis stenosperma]